MTGPADIHTYLAEMEDISGTRVFTAARARQGCHINHYHVPCSNTAIGRLVLEPVT